MPRIHQALTNKYRGRIFDVTKVRENKDWFNQGGAEPRRASAVPRKPGLWVYSFIPVHGCCDHQFELILFVGVSKTGAVRQIATGVYRSYSPTALEEMEVEFFEPDLDEAMKALEEALLPEGGSAPQAQSRHG